MLVIFRICMLSPNTVILHSIRHQCPITPISYIDCAIRIIHQNIPIHHKSLTAMYDSVIVQVGDAVGDGADKIGGITLKVRALLADAVKKFTTEGEFSDKVY